MKLQILQPLHIRRADGDLHLKPGSVADLPDEDATTLLAKASQAVCPVVQPGDLVEWLSPALPKQQAEVLDVYDDGTFEAFHPLSEIVCRMPTAWITRVVNAPTNPEGLTL